MSGIYTPSHHENPQTTLISSETAATDSDLRMPIPQRIAKSTQVRVKLDMDLVDPVLLNNEVALENALCILEGHLQNTAVNQESFIKDLTSVPNLFELVFSGKWHVGISVSLMNF